MGKTVGLMGSKLLFVVIFFLIVGCKKDDGALVDCGCNNEVIRTVPSGNYNIPFEVQTRGKLLYKHPEITNRYLDQPIMDNKFWIVQSFEDCHNCRQHYIVCNEELLNAEFDRLKETGAYDSIDVSFYGRVRRLYCDDLEPSIVPADYSYSRIDLDSIKIIQ